jgi:hypothetical protein
VRRGRDLNPPTVSGRFGERASILGEIKVTPNVTTCRYVQNEVFLSVIVSKCSVHRISPVADMRTF